MVFSSDAASPFSWRSFRRSLMLARLGLMSGVFVHPFLHSVVSGNVPEENHSSWKPHRCKSTHQQIGAQLSNVVVSGKIFRTFSDWLRVRLPPSRHSQSDSCQSQQRASSVVTLKRSEVQSHSRFSDEKWTRLRCFPLIRTDRYKTPCLVDPMTEPSRYFRPTDICFKWNMHKKPWRKGLPRYVLKESGSIQVYKCFSRFCDEPGDPLVF